MFSLLASLPGLVLTPAAFFSGGLAAAFSHTLLVPVDVVKTKIQNEPNKYSGGLVQTARLIVDEAGPGALVLGAGPTLVGYALHGGFKYGLYEAFKPEVAVMLYSLRGGEHAIASAGGGPLDVLLVLLAAGLASECFASVVLCPLEAARIRAVCDPAYAGLSLGDAMAKLMSGPRGVLGAWDGLAPGLLKTCPYTACQLGIYELSRGYLSQLGFLGGAFAVQLLSALTAAVIASLASQPGDTLLSRVNNREVEAAACALGAAEGGGKRGSVSGGCGSGSLIDLAAELGPAGLFRGTAARLVQVSLIVVVQLLVNDKIRAACGLAEMGERVSATIVAQLP